MDFTLQKYGLLLKTIVDEGYNVVTVKEAITNLTEHENVVILRHDVDKRPQNALTMAELEDSHGIKSTYYFRTTKEVYREDIIKKISNLGHEIGFHYETLVKSNGDFDKAIELFAEELKKFKEIVSIETICVV